MWLHEWNMPCDLFVHYLSSALSAHVTFNCYTMCNKSNQQDLPQLQDVSMLPNLEDQVRSKYGNVQFYLLFSLFLSVCIIYCINDLYAMQSQDLLCSTLGDVMLSWSNRKTCVHMINTANIRLQVKIMFLLINLLFW